MKFTAAGDVLCQRRLPQDYEGFAEIRDFILKGDGRFFNLETTVNYEGEVYANQFSGGTWVRCTPEVAEDMLDYGFNMTNINNNHAMDFAHEGMIKTIEYVEDMGIIQSGVGMNLHQAAAPAYLETKNGRVALIGISTSFKPPMMAGEQSRRIPGRPGVNGIRISQKLMVPKAAFDTVKEIGEKTHINDPKNITRAEGYFPWPEEGTAEIGEMNFVLGEEFKIVNELNKADMKRVTDSIREAAMQADYVMISLHAHQIIGSDKHTVPAILEELCHALIDAGADAVVGHGPHLVRAIEVYNQKPIFYSLGDFLIQLYQLPIAPEDFYKSYGMNSDSAVIELLKKRSRDFSCGLMEDLKMRESVIPYWETDENKNLTKLVLMPVTASLREGKHLEGLPQPSKDIAFIEKLAGLSKPYGVHIEMKDGLAVCTW